MVSRPSVTNNEGNTKKRTTWNPLGVVLYVWSQMDDFFSSLTSNGCESRFKCPFTCQTIDFFTSRDIPGPKKAKDRMMDVIYFGYFLRFMKWFCFTHRNHTVLTVMTRYLVPKLVSRPSVTNNEGNTKKKNNMESPRGCSLFLIL